MNSNFRSLAVLCLVFASLPVASAQGPWVRDGADGRLLYRHDPLGNRIMDFSGAGYGGGHVAIPDVPVVHTILQGTGSDDTARVQAAIDLVSAMPQGRTGFRGALLLGPGEFKIAGTLVVSASGVVLRGSGQGAGGTVLRATGSQLENSRLLLFNGAGSRSSVGNTRNITNTYVPVGARSFSVDNATDFIKGQEIFIRHPSPQAWIEETNMHLLANPWAPGNRDQDFERRITHIEGNRIFIDEPLPWAIESRFGGATVRGLAWSSTGRIDQVGIEDIRGISDFTSATDENHSWNFVIFNRVTHGWARRITSEHFAYSCVNLSSMNKWITVANCSSLTPKSVITGGRRYAFPVQQSECVLVHDCFMTEDRHGFVTHSNTAGPIAFVDGLSLDTKSDHGPHHRWATGLLFDSINVQGNRINIQNRGNSGTGHGWAGANSVVWNTIATSGYTIQNPPGAKNWAIGNTGSIINGTMFVGPAPALGEYESHGTQVFPQSLYWAQWQDRAREGMPVETRDYWLGDIDTFAAGGTADAAVQARASWLSAVTAADGSLTTAGFDTLATGRRVPFTFNFTLGPGKRVAAARLVLAMRGASGSSATTATARIGTTANSHSFASLGWSLFSTETTTATLDLADQLALLQTGAFDVSIEKGAGVDWAMLELQLADDSSPDSTLVLTADADAYTQGGTSSALNFGSATSIQVKEDLSENVRRRGHIRWQIPPVPNTVVTRATVRLTLTTASSADMENFAGIIANPSWSEAAITWANQPPRVHRLASWRCVPGTIEFAVTPYLQKILSQGGNFGIVVQGARANVGVTSYAARENANAVLRPQLILELAPAATTLLAEDFETTELGARPATLTYLGLGTNTSAAAVSFRSGKGLKIYDNNSSNRVRVESNFVPDPSQEPKLFSFAFAARRNASEFSTAADSSTSMIVTAGSHGADLSSSVQRPIEVRLRQDGRLLVTDGSATLTSDTPWPGIDTGVNFSTMVNAGATAVGYRGPDGAAHVLGAGKWALWADQAPVQLSGKSQFDFRPNASSWTSGGFGRIGFVTGNSASNVGISHIIDDILVDVGLPSFPRLGFGRDFEADATGAPPAGFSGLVPNTNDATAHVTVVQSPFTAAQEAEEGPAENSRSLKLHDSSTTTRAAVEANFVGSGQAQRDLIEFSFRALRNPDFDTPAPASSNDVALIAALGSFVTASGTYLNNESHRPVDIRLRQDGRLTVRDGAVFRASAAAVPGLDAGRLFTLIANPGPTRRFYRAPDGRPAAAEPGSFSLWIGSQPFEIDGISQFAFSTSASDWGGRFGRLGFYTGQNISSAGISYTIDDLVAGSAEELADAPPPSTVAWDAGSSGPGAQGGTGTWNASAPNWWSDNPPQNLPWPAGDFNSATFGADGGVVTIVPSIRASSLSFGSSGYTVAGGSLILTGPSPTLEIADAVTTTISAPLLGSGGLQKTGTGTLILTAPGYSGNTVVHGGLIDFGTLGPDLPGGNFGLINSAVLQAAGIIGRALSDTSPAGFHIQPGTTASFAARGGDLTLNFGAAVPPASVLLGPASLLGQDFHFGSPTADGKTILRNPLNLAAATRTVTVANDTAAELAGSLSNGSISKLGTGTLILSGDNTFGQGTLTLGPSSGANVGALRLAAPAALGGHTTVSLNAGAGGVSRLELIGGHVFNTAHIITRGRPNALAAGATLVNVSGENTWNGDITIIAGGGSYVIRCDAGKLTLNGSIANDVVLSETIPNRAWDFAGAADIVVNGPIAQKPGTVPLLIKKSGPAILTLTGSNTYSGATTVLAGTLRIDGNQSAASGSIQVSSGAVLTGSGISGGGVTLFQGALLGTTLRNWTPAGADLLQVASLTTGGAAPILVVDTSQLINFEEAAARFTILRAPGGIVAFDPSLATIQVPGFSGTGTWSISRSATELTLNYQPDFNDPFLAWASGYDLGSPADPAGDPDHDGIATLIEFVIGGNPATTPDHAKLPAAVLADGDFLVTYRRTAASAYLAPSIEYTTALAGRWTPAEHGVDGVAVTVTPDGFGAGIDRVEVRLPAALAADGKLFARLTVTSSS